MSQAHISSHAIYLHLTRLYLPTDNITPYYAIQHLAVNATSVKCLKLIYA